MFIINNMYTYTYEVSKSKFIGNIFRIESEEDFQKKLDSIKEEFPKADHYCYAYRLLDTYKMDDDGEPSSTAGSPIYNVIESNELYNTAIVVVRYFGGTKLGAGGLVRAYTKAASNLIEENRLNKLIPACQITMTINYDNIKMIDNMLKNCNAEITSKEFEELVIYSVVIAKDDLEKIKNITFEIVKDTMIEINA